MVSHIVYAGATQYKFCSSLQEAMSFVTVFGGGEIYVNMKIVDERQKQINGLQRERDVAVGLLEDKRDEAWALAHVLVEEGVYPQSCRCDQCRSVAVQMDEAGYLNRVKDRWWIDKGERI